MTRFISHCTPTGAALVGANRGSGLGLGHRRQQQLADAPVNTKYGRHPVTLGGLALLRRH